MYIIRLEISGIYQQNPKVLNNLKGKPVLSTLQYISELYLTTLNLTYHQNKAVLQ